MAAFITELDNATGKRKRDGNGNGKADEGRDVLREKEIEMKIAQASQYKGTAQPIFSASSSLTARPIFSPRQRTPSSTHKRRFLLSPKESTTFPGSPTYNALHASLDPFTTSPYTATQSPPSFNLPYTINSLAEGIRVINQEISQQRPVVPAPRQHAQVKVNLNPCHICKRRPVLRRDLDGFVDCEGCGERCCWICVRQCLRGMGVWDRGGNEGEDLEMGDAEEHKEHKENADKEGGERDGGEGWEGWPARGGHKAMICSACCVERGADGEVRCLGCLRAEEAGAG